MLVIKLLVYKLYIFEFKLIYMFNKSNFNSYLNRVVQFIFEKSFFSSNFKRVISIYGFKSYFVIGFNFKVRKEMGEVNTFDKKTVVK